MAGTTDSFKRLVTAWRAVAPPAPFALPGDQQALQQWGERTVIHDSFDSYVDDDVFGLPDRRLHLGLVPAPYLGNLARADIFLLLLNPGLGPAEFLLCRDREGAALRRFPLASGDLLLLRAPGFAGRPSGRPLHAVSGPKGAMRYSITLRMERQAENTVSL